MTAQLAQLGFAATRAQSNLGHLRSRMTFPRATQRRDKGCAEDMGSGRHLNRKGILSEQDSPRRKPSCRPGCDRSAGYPHMEHVVHGSAGPTRRAHPSLLQD